MLVLTENKHPKSFKLKCKYNTERLKRKPWTRKSTRSIENEMLTLSRGGRAIALGEPMKMAWWSRRRSNSWKNEGAEIKRHESSLYKWVPSSSPPLIQPALSCSVAKNNEACKHAYSKREYNWPKTKKKREYKIISAVKESRLHGRVVQVYRVCVVFVYCAVSNIMKMIVSREH